MHIRHFAGVVVLSAAVTASWAQQTAPKAKTVSADAGWSAIKQCAGIAEDSTRHDCLDDVLRKTGLMPAHSVPPAASSKTAPTPAPGAPVASPTAAPPATHPPKSATSAGPTKDSRSNFGLQTKTFPQPAPKSTQSSAADRQQQVTLARVDQAGDGKLLLTTTDGAIWKQLESAPIRPLPAGGQAMTIEKVSLGGFLCEPSKYVSFRCFRAK